MRSDVVTVVGGVGASVAGADGVLDIVDGAAVFGGEAAEEHTTAFMGVGLLSMFAERVVHLLAQSQQATPPRTFR
jgi:hypothetical protein